MKTRWMLACVAAMAAGLAFAAEEPAKTPAKTPAEKPAGERKGWDPLAAFKAADTNGDGAISLEEFKASRAGQRDPAAAETKFKARDLDKNGSLSLEEFKARPHRDGAKGEAPGAKASPAKPAGGAKTE